MPGGNQPTRIANTVRKGFPKVPSDVKDEVELRRHLQGLRDALNESRWLFQLFGGFNNQQRTNLSNALKQIAGQNQNIQNLTTSLQQLEIKHDQELVALEQKHDVEVQQLNNTITQLQNTQAGDVTNLTNLITALEQRVTNCGCA